VRRIVVAEDAAGLGLAPAHSRTRHEAMEKSGVQVFEDRVQIVEMASWRAQELAAAHLPDQVRFADDLVAADIFPIAGCGGAVDRLAIHLGEQDVSDRPKNRIGRSFEEVREAHEETPVAQANRVVDVGEGEEFHLQFGQGSARAELIVCFLEDFEDAGTHGEGRVARRGRRQVPILPAVSKGISKPAKCRKQRSHLNFDCFRFDSDRHVETMSQIEI